MLWGHKYLYYVRQPVTYPERAEKVIISFIATVLYKVPLKVAQIGFFSRRFSITVVLNQTEQINFLFSTNTYQVV